MNDLARILLVLAGVAANMFAVWAGLQASGAVGAASDDTLTGDAGIQTINNDAVTAGARRE